MVSDPSGYLPSVVKVTNASPFCSDTPVTEPILIPDNVTSLAGGDHRRPR